VDQATPPVDIRKYEPFENSGDRQIPFLWYCAILAGRVFRRSAERPARRRNGIFKKKRQARAVKSGEIREKRCVFNYSRQFEKLIQESTSENS